MTEPFIFSNGQVAHSAEDLIEICQQSPEDSLGYLLREDFEKWLAYIGAEEVAKYATEARQADVTDEQKINLLISKTQPQTEPELATPTASTETNTKPKVSFFTAVATFFMVLFDRKDRTSDRATNTQ